MTNATATASASAQLALAFLENKMISEMTAKAVFGASDEAEAVSAMLESIDAESLTDAARKCFEYEMIDEAQLDGLLRTVEQVAKTSGREAEPSRAGKSPEAAKGKPFTDEQIQALIDKGENLYAAVPGHLLPKTNNVLYVHYQLFRFIDSGASDFFLQTRKKDGMISYEIQFKIAGENETQDRTEYAYPDDSRPGTENGFFEMVRKKLGDTARINADLKHVAQDGSFSLQYRGRTRDFRLNSMPARANGKPLPRYAIRLTSDGNSIDFDKIRMFPFTKAKYERMIAGKVAGAIIVTGPTGSGKTTTIYGMLNKVDSEKYGVLSVEKPIESSLNGVFQTEEDSVPRDDPKESYTLLQALPGILRQALDVVFVGEMRSQEEIRGTIESALVGNKLITTLHTNSAVDTFLRLEKNGIDRNVMGNAVKFVTAQRLVPTLCPKCSRPDPDAARAVEEIRRPFTRSRRFLEDAITKAFSAEQGIRDMDDLYIAFEKHLRFLAQEDFEGIIDAVRSDQDGFLAALKDGNLARYLVMKSSGFPNRKERGLLDSLLANPNVRVAGSGCGHSEDGATCRGGYLSVRTGIYEVLELDKSVRRKIQDPATRLVEFEDFLLDRGFVTLRMEGGFRVLEGNVSYQDLKASVDE